MRVLYSIGVVLSICLIGLSVLYGLLVIEAKMDYMFSDFTFADRSYSRLTIEAMQVTLPIFLFFLVLSLFGLIKVKTKTSKFFSIIGMVFSFLIIAWGVVIYVSPSAISFDEVAPVWVLFGLFVLSSSVVGLVQAVRYRKLVLSGRTDAKRLESIDLLDS